MPRAFFNVMADEGARVADWREAFHYGQAKATGVPQLLKLIERVVDMHEERARLRRAQHALSRGRRRNRAQAATRGQRGEDRARPLRRRRGPRSSSTSGALGGS